MLSGIATDTALMTVDENPSTRGGVTPTAFFVTLLKLPEARLGFQARQFCSELVTHFTTRATDTDHIFDVSEDVSMNICSYSRVFGRLHKRQ